MSDTPARIPPMVESDEATAAQLQTARRQGDAYAEALQAMREDATVESRTAGDYLVAVATEEAEGMYVPQDGSLVWAPSGDGANCHLEVAVADAADGRFVPGLTVMATVREPSGAEVFTTEVPFVWHPFLHHYGVNGAVPAPGEYDVHVRIETPRFMRHDPRNGRRYEGPVEVTFERVRFETGAKESPDGRPRGGPAPTAS